MSIRFSDKVVFYNAELGYVSVTGEGGIWHFSQVPTDAAVFRLSRGSSTQEIHSVMEGAIAGPNQTVDLVVTAGGVALYLERGTTTCGKKARASLTNVVGGTVEVAFAVQDNTNRVILNGDFVFVRGEHGSGIRWLQICQGSQLFFDNTFNPTKPLLQILKVEPGATCDAARTCSYRIACAPGIRCPEKQFCYQRVCVVCIPDGGDPVLNDPQSCCGRRIDDGGKCARCSGENCSYDADTNPMGCPCLLEGGACEVTEDCLGELVCASSKTCQYLVPLGGDCVQNYDCASEYCKDRACAKKPVPFWAYIVVGVFAALVVLFLVMFFWHMAKKNKEEDEEEEEDLL